MTFSYEREHKITLLKCCIISQPELTRIETIRCKITDTNYHRIFICIFGNLFISECLFCNSGFYNRLLVSTKKVIPRQLIASQVLQSAAFIAWMLHDKVNKHNNLQQFNVFRFGKQIGLEKLVISAIHMILNISNLQHNNYQS